MKHEDVQIKKVDFFSKKGFRDEFPEIIEIHPTDKCNHKCNYCFHGGIGYNPKRDNKLLKLTEYSELFRQMDILNIKNLSVSGGGEPFLDKRIYDILNAALLYKLKIRIVTNGNLIKLNRVDTLLKLQELRISIDTLSGDIYSKIRKVSPKLLETTIKKIKILINEKKKINSSLQIGVTFLLNEMNKSEIYEFCSFFTSLGIDEIIIKYDIYSKICISDVEYQILRKKISSNFPKVKFRKEIALDSIVGTKCFIPYFKPSFNPYGELFSCCLGSQPNETNGYFLGKYPESSIQEIWENSSSLRTSLRCKGVKCINCNYTDYLINKSIG